MYSCLQLFIYFNYTCFNIYCSCYYSCSHFSPASYNPWIGIGGSTSYQRQVLPRIFVFPLKAVYLPFKTRSLCNCEVTVMAPQVPNQMRFLLKALGLYNRMSHSIYQRCGGGGAGGVCGGDIFKKHLSSCNINPLVCQRWPMRFNFALFSFVISFPLLSTHPAYSVQQQLPFWLSSPGFGLAQTQKHLDCFPFVSGPSCLFTFPRLFESLKEIY